MRSPGPITSMSMNCCWSANAAGRVAGYGAASHPPSDAVSAWGVLGTSCVPGRELVPVPWVLMDGFGAVPGTAVP